MWLTLGLWLNSIEVNRIICMLKLGPHGALRGESGTLLIARSSPTSLTPHECSLPGWPIHGRDRGNGLCGLTSPIWITPPPFKAFALRATLPYLQPMWYLISQQLFVLTALSWKTKIMCLILHFSYGETPLPSVKGTGWAGGEWEWAANSFMARPSI